MTLFKNSYLMQAVGTQDSPILDDEPFRQFRFVAFQVTTNSKPDVIIPVHKVKKEFDTMGEDAFTEHPLFEVMIQDMITDSEFYMPVLHLASHTSHAGQASTCLPIDPSLAQFQRRNRHAELPHAGKLCLRPLNCKTRGTPPAPFIDIMREQNKRTTSSGGVLDVTPAMSETRMVLV